MQLRRTDQDRFSLSGLRPVEEAISALLETVVRTEKTQTLVLDSALNRCLASEIKSLVNVPPADNSAMDGYAVSLASVSEGDWIPVAMRIPAGSVGDTLKAGTAARIFTGAPVPDGADTVVMQENCEAEGEQVRIKELPQAGANVRSKGQDIGSGATVVAAGERLTPERLSLIASVGVPEVSVCQPLRIALLSTGDELVEPGNNLSAGQIYNSNHYALSGMIRNMGMEAVDLGIVADNPEDTDQALQKAAEEADIVMTTGGVSVGEEDHVKAAVERMGHLDLWKLAIKPGKPFAFGDVSGKPFFGLPGNPVSTFVTFCVIAKPFLMAMQGYSDVLPGGIELPADFEFSGGSRREYLRVRLTSDGSGMTRLEKFPNQGSGIMSSVVWADGLAVVEIGQQVRPGDHLTFYPV